MNAEITEQKYGQKHWLQKMAVLAILLLLLFMLTACGNSSSQTVDVPEGTVLVEIIYLNHGPVRSVLAEIDTLMVDYEGKVIVVNYDFDSPEGEAFAEERSLNEHTPIAIYLNGQREFTLDGRTIEFYSFPQGLGTGVVPDGAWTLDDLRIVLDMSIAEAE